MFLKMAINGVYRRKRYNMKKNEIITINGVEYTLELNRKSALLIEQRTNAQKVEEALSKPLYEQIEVIPEDEDPFAEGGLDIDTLIKEAEERKNVLEHTIATAFYIWLYPNHKLSIKQVEELLKPCFDDEEKIKELSSQYEQFMKESSSISQEYMEQQKNLKALANK